MGAGNFHVAADGVQQAFMGASPIASSLGQPPHRPLAFEESARQASQKPPYAWDASAAEQAAWSRYDPENFYTPTASAPWASALFLLIALCGPLLFWACAFVVQRRRRLVLSHMKGMAAPDPQVEGPGTDGQASAEMDKNLHVLLPSMEHSLPHLQKAKAVAGGLGKVMDLVVRHHPTRITMVHPMLEEGPKVNYELADRATEKRPLKVMVDGSQQHVRVFKMRGARANGEGGPEVDFLLLGHPWFEERTVQSIYPNPMTRRSVQNFFALWNQAVGQLIAQCSPELVHLPDFHTAMAPWYAVEQCPRLAVVLTLHNADYQGMISTDMIRGGKLDTLAKIWNMPGDQFRKQLIFEGRFNLLNAAVSFIKERQAGKGIYAVSKQYAEEVAVMHSVFWGVPVGALDNPMLEAERAQFEGGVMDVKRKAKLETQRSLGLREDPEARIFAMVGRLGRQKGVDIIADIAPWLLSAFEKAQLIVIGPVVDGYGVYAEEKLKALDPEDPRYKGKLYVKTEFTQVNDSLKFAADFCLMPSRAEPFGYVDIEFAWRGAVMVGAEVGGLGKVPGFYFIAQNRDNLKRLQRELRTVIAQAMGASALQLQQMVDAALHCSFPLDAWQRKLRAAYHAVLPEQQATLARPGTAVELVDVASSAGGRQSAAATQESKGAESQAHAERREEPEIRRKSFSLLEESLTDGEGPKRRSLVGTKVGGSFGSCGLTQVSATEFLTQELSTEELAEKMQQHVKGTRLTLQEIEEAIGREIDMQREPLGSMSHWLLQPFLGTARIHALVICGYIAAPLVDLVIFVFATEWALRTGALMFSFTLPSGPGGKPMTVPLRWDSLPALTFAFFVARCLAGVVGPLLWACAARFAPPKIVLSANLLAQFVCLLGACFYRGTLPSALQLVFVHGLVGSGSMIFMAFSFMMSTKGDLSSVVLRGGAIEIVRNCLVWLPLTFVLLILPTNVAGTEEEPIPMTLSLVLAPVTVAALAFTVVPGILVLFAPGPYSNDRFPGWEFWKISTRRSVMLLGLSDCIGALYLFPSMTYLWWWLSSGWTFGNIALLSLATALLFIVCFSVWSLILSKVLQIGFSLLIGFTVLPLSSAVIRAFAQKAVSDNTVLEPSCSALLLCVASVIFEACRLSVQWTARIKILNSQWRLLSYGSVLASIVAFCAFLSGPLTFKAGYNQAHFIFLGTTNPRLIANLTMKTVVPVAMLMQLPVQTLAVFFINKDLGIIRHSQDSEHRSISPTALALTIGVFSMLMAQRIYSGMMDHDIVYFPTNRCPGWQRIDEIPDLMNLCTHTHTEVGTAFEVNSNLMITTARYNCLQLMQHQGGDSFALVTHPGDDDNECQILMCNHNLTSGRAWGPFDNWDQELEVWSRHCPMAQRGRANVGVQLHEWNWTDIGLECETRLGEEGWSYVQVSPPAEHALGYSWSDKYQPVSFKLNSRSGTEKEFRQMVQRCRKVGVSVMVDFVINHFATPVPPNGTKQVVDNGEDPMCGRSHDCRGWDGTWYGVREYGGNDTDLRTNRFRTRHFHHSIGNERSNCGLDLFTMTDFTFNVFDDAPLCDISGCVDIHTEDLETQRMIQRFMLRLIDAGVTMLRVDAAMAMYAQSLASILQPFPWEYVVQEIIGANTSSSAMYQDVANRKKVSSFYDSTYGSDIGEALKGNFTRANFAKLPDTIRDGRGSNFALSRDQALVYLDNHDSQRNEFAFRPTFLDGMGYLSLLRFMLIHPWGGTVRIMSSYNFTNSTAGPPGDVVGLKLYPSRVECRDMPDSFPASRSWLDQAPYWICEHRWLGVPALVRLRRLLGGTIPHIPQLTRQVKDTDRGRMAFSLGDEAFAALTLPARVGEVESVGDSHWDLAGLDTGLPQAKYCNLAQVAGALPRPDEWAGSKVRGDCSTGDAITVDRDGAVSHGSVRQGGAVVLHRLYPVY